MKARREQEGRKGTKAHRAHRHEGETRADPTSCTRVGPPLRAYVPLPGAGSSYTQDAQPVTSPQFPRLPPPPPVSTHLIQRLRDNITSVYMGNTAAVDRVIVCLLARGHVLIEDVPGVGKTVLANALAKSIHCSFTRIQCTPDLLPSDIIGVTIYDREEKTFQFKHGPIFHNIIVADEINRTTPRTQSALLEAMSETSVSVDGQMHALPQPFMVAATQNPYEFEGTYFLPENQLDRFLMRINLGYPAPDDESRIIQKQPARTTLTKLQPVMSA